MALRTLKISQLEQNGLARLKTLQPSIDTTVYGSIITTLIRSLAATAYPITYLAQDVYSDSFPQTAAGEALDAIGALSGLSRKPASPSKGTALLLKTLVPLPVLSDTPVPIGTEFTTGSVTVYTQSPVVVNPIVYTISSISATGDIATVTLTNIHNFAKGVRVKVITGNVGYDGVSSPGVVTTREIIGIPSSTSFAFKLDSSVPLPTLTVGAVEIQGTVVSVVSKVGGSNQNLFGDSLLSGDTSNLYDVAYIDYNGLSGGADEETDDAYRQRIIAARNVLDGVFTPAQVVSAALTVPGNTRAWVVSPEYLVAGGVPGEPGYLPQPGQVVVYIIQDIEDGYNTPTQSVLDDTRNAIVALGRMPVHTVKEDIFVFSPIFQPVDFEIGDLTPNVPSLKAAIEQELKAFIQDYLGLGEGFTRNQMISVITNTVDSVGNKPVDFNLITESVEATGSGLITYGSTSWL
jgi:uncharacterized phage protein gp47/JayE